MRSSTTSTLLSLLSALSAVKACTSVTGVELTFYGYPDNDPPGASTAYNCGGRNYVAGGTGTYDDPVTFATAKGEFNVCEILYVPYLEKYVRYEDSCAQCTTDYNNGQKHIDIFTGSSTVNGGQEQINCEDSLTPSSKKGVIRNPATNYGVDTAPLYHKGTSNPCRTNHVYNSNNDAQYCK